MILHQIVHYCLLPATVYQVIFLSLFFAQCSDKRGLLGYSLISLKAVQQILKHLSLPLSLCVPPFFSPSRVFSVRVAMRRIDMPSQRPP